MNVELTPLEGMQMYLMDLFTAIMGWVGNVANTIVSNPILLLTTGFLVVGGAIGIFGRLLSKN